MATTLGKPSDKADHPESAPDSVSRSVVREGAQAAARYIVKWGAPAAAPAPQASLTVSRQPSHPGCGKMRRLRRARRSVEPRDVRPWRRALARASKRKTASCDPLRCTASQVRRYAGPPRLRSPGYDLRCAPRILPHFASNAIRGGLNQRFLRLWRLKRVPVRGPCGRRFERLACRI